MIKLTKESFKKQNMVVCMGDYGAYRRRSIMFYCFLFGGTAASYGAVFAAMMLFYKTDVAFIVAHVTAMVVFNASLISWVALDLLRPVPVPHGKGVMPKIMSILCLFCAAWVVVLVLHIYSVNYYLTSRVLFTTIFAFILYGLVALFAERCEKVREDAYPSYAGDDDYDLNTDLVTNPAFKDYECNIWHEEDE